MKTPIEDLYKDHLKIVETSAIQGVGWIHCLDGTYKGEHRCALSSISLLKDFWSELSPEDLPRTLASLKTPKAPPTKISGESWHNYILRYACTKALHEGLE